MTNNSINNDNDNANNNNGGHLYCAVPTVSWEWLFNRGCWQEKEKEKNGPHTNIEVNIILRASIQRRIKAGLTFS